MKNNVQANCRTHPYVCNSACFKTYWCKQNTSWSAIFPAEEAILDGEIGVGVPPRERATWDSVAAWVSAISSGSWVEVESSNRRNPNTSKPPTNNIIAHGHENFHAWFLKGNTFTFWWINISIQITPTILSPWNTIYQNQVEPSNFRSISGPLRCFFCLGMLLGKSRQLGR